MTSAEQAVLETQLNGELLNERLKAGAFPAITYSNLCPMCDHKNMQVVRWKFDTAMFCFSCGYKKTVPNDPWIDLALQGDTDGTFEIEQATRAWEDFLK